MPTTPPSAPARAGRTIALAGNPNTGKTTLFNALTGFRQRVGNYPGVTVERKMGVIRHDGDGVVLNAVDLPGAYSLTARSADEAVVLDVLLGRRAATPKPSLIAVVVDATNLGRNLFFASQLLELGIPVIIALTMVDVASDRGLHIDHEALSREVGVPVVPIVATEGKGIEALKRAMIDALGAPADARCPTMPDSIHAEINGLAETVGKSAANPEGEPCRAELLQALLDPGGHHEAGLIQRCGPDLREELARRRARLTLTGESLAEVEARFRYAWIEQITGRVLTRTAEVRRSRSDVADRFLTHPVLGLLVLALLMGACFQSIYGWAGPVMDLIDSAFASVGAWITANIPPGPLQSLLANGVVAGVGAVLTFLPQILILFLFLAVLEDCGYMSRTAFLLDRWMGKLGLNGKSFIPLLSSFACAVPGVLAARTIEDTRSRFVTILIAPLMSCSARLPLYTLLIAAFIPDRSFLGGVVGLRALTMLGMYFVGMVTAVGVAAILQRTVLKGEAIPFLMELPAYKVPMVRTVLFRMYEQGREFCVSAGTIIFAVSIVVWALGYYPHPDSIARDHEARRNAVRAVVPVGDVRDAQLSEIDHDEAGTYLRRSFLGSMGTWIEPIVRPLGWDWRIGTAVIASFPAREVVIATMGTIYNLGSEQHERSVGLRATLQSVTGPGGAPIFTIPVSLSLMVFFALCCQCAATLAVIKRETNSWRWPAMTFAYMTMLAYVGALVTYQVASRLI